MIYEWNLFVVNLKWFTLKWNFCSFPWWKEPKIKASGLLLKRSCRYLLKIFAPKRFILFAPERLILSVICYAASSKSLAFQFTNKTQQSHGQRIILNWELGLINESIIIILLVKQATNRISATLFFLSIRQTLLFLFDWFYRCVLNNPHRYSLFIRTMYSSINDLRKWSKHLRNDHRNEWF